MTDEKRAKIGFVGCGNLSTSALYPNIHLIPEMDIVAVCDLKKDLAERNARNFGGRRVYTDVAKMLKEEELDGAFVVGPAQMHVEVGIQCLEAGVPIFVEKPSAVSVEEAQKLADKAEEKGLFGVVAFMKRFCHVYRLAKEIVSEEEFGGVQLFDMKFTSGEYSYIWGLESEERSFLTGMEVHAFDLARFFCGDVEELHAYTNKPAEKRMGYVVNLKFKSGAIGTINANSLEAWQNYDEQTSLSGMGSYILLDNMLYLRHFSEKPWKHLKNTRMPHMSQNWSPGTCSPGTLEMMGYEGEMRHFVQCCLGNCQPSPDLHDGVEALKIVRAILKSVEEKMPVKVI